MPATDTSFVLMPRFTTLVGATTFTTLPMDVSGYAGAQFHVWRGPFRTTSSDPPPEPPAFTVFLEESLDTLSWVLGPSTPTAFTILEADAKFFSYDFRLRWFRLKVVVTGQHPVVTCWAEGLLRGGGGGAWPDMGIDAGPAGAVRAGSRAAWSGMSAVGSGAGGMSKYEAARARLDYLSRVDPNNYMGWQEDAWMANL